MRSGSIKQHVLRLFLFALLGFLLCTRSPALSMTIVSTGEQMIASGTIGANDCASMRQRIIGNDYLRTVILRNSHGGDIGEMDCLSALISDHHLNTAVSGFCESACAVVFLAGVERRFTDDYPGTSTWVGLQSFYDTQGKILTDRVERLENWIDQQTGRRVDASLAYFWTHIDDPDNMVYIFEKSPIRPESGADIAYCIRKNSTTSRCTLITGTSGLSNHILTAADLIHSSDMFGEIAPK